MFKTFYTNTDQKRIGLNTISFTIKQKKVVARAMKMEAKEDIEALSESRNKNFRFLNTLKKLEKKSKVEDASKTLMEDIWCQKS